jgi:hypothetical protein
MGDGPDGYYHLRRIGYAQGDGRCGGCGGRSQRRDPPDRGFREPPELLIKLTARLSKGGRRLSFCYEAGPYGYGLHRRCYGYATQGYHVFLAVGVTRVEADRGQEEQDLLTRAFALSDIESMIREGDIKDATTVAALGLLRLKSLL